MPVYSIEGVDGSKGSAVKCLFYVISGNRYQGKRKNVAWMRDEIYLREWELKQMGLFAYDLYLLHFRFG